MSIVIAVCGYNYLIMAGDRRLVKVDSDEIIPCDENHHKIFKLNENVLLGLCGNARSAFETLRALSKKELPSLSFEDILKETCDIAKSIDFGKLGMQFIIGGRNKSNEFMLSYAESKTGFTVNNIVPKNDSDYKYTIIFPPDIDDEMRAEIINKCGLHMAINESRECLKNSIRRCIELVSEKSITVNNNIEIIELY